MSRAAVLLLCACSSGSAPAPAPAPDPAPAQTAQTPPQPPAQVTPPAPPAVTPDLQCYYNGPKEYLKLETDVASMTGELTRLTAGDAPYRHLKVRVVPDGARYRIIFDGYHDDDYKPLTPTSLRLTRTEQLSAGTTEIAQLVVIANEPRILSTGLDLQTGMRIKTPDGSFPCKDRR